MPPDNTNVSSVPYVHSELIHNERAASEVVPMLISMFKPSSVIDVGCGIGTWLSVFQKNGVSDVVGVDGDYVDRSKLRIPVTHFVSADLQSALTFPRKFDLALSLEVAEHLSQESADTFVDSLVNLSEVVIFSAALPGQGGQNHINEQWSEYWKAKFYARGYTFYDDLRPLIWWNENIEWWYKQNIFLVIKDSRPYERAVKNPVISAIHPEMHSYYKRIYEEKIARLSRIEQHHKMLIAGKGSLKTSVLILIRTLSKIFFK